MAEAETLLGRVHEELARRGVDHATVELCPAFDHRETHLDDHGHLA